MKVHVSENNFNCTKSPNRRIDEEASILLNNVEPFFASTNGFDNLII